MKSELPVVTCENGVSAAQAVLESGLASSLGEARRFMQNNGITLNGEKIGQDYVLTHDDRKAAGSALLRRGKNTYALVDIA